MLLEYNITYGNYISSRHFKLNFLNCCAVRVTTSMIIGIEEVIAVVVLRISKNIQLFINISHLWGKWESCVHNFVHLIPSLHFRRRCSSRLSARSEWDEVLVNVDIHTLVWELRDKVEHSLNNEARHSLPLTRIWCIDMFPGASRRNKNRSRM